MSDKDIVVSTAMNVPMGSLIAQKPSYLVKFKREGKNTQKLFVAIEQPKFETSFIQVKGFFYENDEEVLYKTYSEVVGSSDKNLYVEMWLPWHTIDSVRSLVFKGDKNRK